MTSLTMDGGNRIVGTEFVKLLITGSSNLATEEYVDNKVSEEGGANVDLSNYYTQTETDNLLNNKLNVNNPQDITGKLRLDPTNGNSKLIIIAVAPAQGADDFYCNGNGHFNGTLRVSVLTSDGDITADGVNANAFNSNVVSNDIVFNHNGNEYQRFSVSDDSLNLSKDLDMKSSTLKTNTISTNGLTDLVFNVDTVGEFLRCQFSDNTVRVPNTRSFLSQDIYLNNLRPLSFGNDLVFNGGNSISNAYEEFFRLTASTERVNFVKVIDTNQSILMKPNRFLYFDATGDKIRYITATERSSPSVQNHIDIVNMNTAEGRIRLLIGNTGSDEQFLVDNTIISCKRNLRAGAGLETNTIDTIGSANLSFQRGGTEYLRFDTTNDNITCSKQIVASEGVRVVDSGDSIQCNFVENSTDERMVFSKASQIDTYTTGGINKRTLYLNFDSYGDVFLGTNRDTSPDPKPTITINKFSSNTGNAFEVEGNSVFSGTVSTNTIKSNGDNDLVFQRNGTTYLTLDDANGGDIRASTSITVVNGNNYLYTNNIRDNTGTELNIYTLSTMKFWSNAINQMEIKQTQIDL